ncbi:alpha/beta hydrolase domain-containing protein [Chloroflexota bacterium]
MLIPILLVTLIAGTVVACCSESTGPAGPQGPAGPEGPAALPAGMSVTPVPTVEGPIPITDTSTPYAAVDQLESFTDPSVTLDALFASAGYVFEEYFFSGTANLYDLMDERGTVIRPIRHSVPYTNRIQVVRPADKAGFSGTVFVEIGHQNDTFYGFKVLSDIIMDRGDAFVGMTAQARPSTAAAMKQSDPERYANISWPSTSEVNSEPDVGYIYDMLSQVGALLKSDAPDNPLAGYGVEYIYTGGFSRTGAEITTYVTLFHPQAYLATGEHVFDGFLFGVSGASATSQSWINNTNFALPGLENLVPGGIKGIVPTIVVNSESEIGTFEMPIEVMRRTNSDIPGDQYAYYEVPGTIHSPLTGDPAQYASRLMEIPNDNPARSYVHRASYVNLDLWVRDGTPPPQVAPIEIENPLEKDPNSPYFRWGEIVRDEFGNAKGGVRHPWVEAPIATYTSWYTPGPGDIVSRLGYFLYGYKVPFSDEQLEDLYGTHDGYAEAVAASVDENMADGLMLTKDGEALKQMALDSKVLVEPAVVPEPIEPKPVPVKSWEGPPMPSGWYSVRDKIRYSDPIDYYVPYETGAFEPSPSIALAVFWALPGFELTKVDVTEGTTNEQLREMVKDEVFPNTYGLFTVIDEGDITLDEGTSTVYLTASGSRVMGYVWQFTSAFYVVDDAGYVLTAYDHIASYDSNADEMLQVLKTMHKQ